MTRTELKKNLSNDIEKLLVGSGYALSKKQLSFLKTLENCEIKISVDMTTAGYPKNIISINILVFINLPEINSIGATLFTPPPVNPATLWGNIRIFTSANSNYNTSYYFDILKDHHTQLEALKKDLLFFDGFASKLTSLEALSNKALSKTPVIRKNFEQGLTWDYKYGYPQYISIIHALNNEIEDARNCAMNANHLSAVEKERLLDFIESHSTE